MQRVPLLCKTEEVDRELTLSTRVDKFGKIFHCVEFPDSDTPSGRNYALFEHLSSALDFIKTNFR